MLKIAIFLLAIVINVKSEWFENGNFYQIYPRSFKDSDGDGVGDLRGITSKLQYLKDLGIDGVWLSPIFKSPMFDFGYDISDYRQIHEEYGTLEHFDELIAECKRIGIRLILDFVPNHSSSEHEWFKRSERNESGFEDFYIWRNPKIDEVSNIPIPPTNWVSVFRYSAWRWSPIRQQMYYHMFQYRQPDLNYRNPKVVEEMKSILTYWMEKGVSGFRIDAIPALFENIQPNGSFLDEPRSYSEICDAHDHCSLKAIYTEDQPETYDMVYQWRKLVDDFTNARNIESKILMTESSPPVEENVKYYGNATMEGAHFPFNFELLLKITKNSTAEDYKNLIDLWLEKMPKNHMANWVLGNHDRSRIATRLGVEKGDMLNILLQTLPGCAITYQGEELVMENVPIAWEDTVDPLACNSPRDELEWRSRDPVRTPFPWDDTKNAGFSTGNKTWLPVGENYMKVNVKAQEEATNSHLKIFKKLTKIRKETRFKYGTYVGNLTNDKNIFTYKREYGNDFAIIVLNFGHNEENVDLNSVFAKLPSQLKIYTSSLESGFKDDEFVNTNAVKIKSSIGIVLVNSSIVVTQTSVFLLLAVLLFQLFL